MFHRQIATACALLGAGFAGSMQAATSDANAVLIHYADMAQAKYADALKTAKDLQAAVDTLLASPSADTLASARAAWKTARAPYQQTEVYRFGNAIVDDWEGKVNAWPLDEGLIDYVDTSAYGEESDENPYYSANVIANETLTLSGREINASEITKTLLADELHEVDAIEANVSTGYHAVEFLLWGQDLNGTGPGAGDRPATDFDPDNCTGGHCGRRGAYLRTATELLVDDLTWITEQWDADGAAREALLQDPKQGLAMMLTGLGSLSYGELAGERMRLGLMLHDPEEEHDCFSDNTHWSHYYNVLGMQNIVTGTYKRVDGSSLNGPSLAELLAAKDADAADALRLRLEESLAQFDVLVDSAEQEGVAYDQLLADDNDAGNAKIQAAIDALLAQTKAIEAAVTALDLDGVSIEGSDSLDNPQAVLHGT
ncbi:MAG: hypothetical protein K9M02_20450 [Thiohalocapsa sp.]|nr:hypothetical protein [Thiohalocapsa sp.]